MRIGKRLRNDGAYIGFIADGSCKANIEEISAQLAHL